MFADEAGNFDFSSNGTEHFTVCAVTMRSLEVGHRLLDLRHELALEGMDVRTDGNHIQMFHATEDRQAVRDRVFSLIRAAPLEIDAIVIEKRKTRPDIAADEDYFYQLAWHRLFKYMAPRRARNDDDLLVVAGSLGDPREKDTVQSSVDIGGPPAQPLPHPRRPLLGRGDAPVSPGGGLLHMGDSPPRREEGRSLLCAHPAPSA